MDITALTGTTAAQHTAPLSLGAIEQDAPVVNPTASGA
jgi:hypothetical protein